MLKFLTFEAIKDQLRLDDAQAEQERRVLEMYAVSAEDTVLDLIRQTYEEVVFRFGEWPKRLTQAALMLVDSSYQNRSAVSQQSMAENPGFAILVKPFMRLSDYDI